MALYLGNSNEKLKIVSNNTKVSMKIVTMPTIFSGVKLLSSDNYVLQDMNGVYLTAKESE